MNSRRPQWFFEGLRRQVAETPESSALLCYGGVMLHYQIAAETCQRPSKELRLHSVNLHFVSTLCPLCRRPLCGTTPLSPQALWLLASSCDTSADHVTSGYAWPQVVAQRKDLCSCRFPSLTNHRIAPSLPKHRAKMQKASPPSAATGHTYHPASKNKHGTEL